MAGVDAAQTQNASVFGISDQRRCVRFCFFRLPVGGEIDTFYLMFEYEILQAALTGRIADGTFKRVIYEEEFEILLTHAEEFFRPGRDRYALDGGRGAGRHGFFVSVDLNDA
jgi:hypothetical protein